MTRTVLTLVASLFIAPIAAASEPLHTLGSGRVEENNRVLYFWSLDCRSCAGDLSRLEELSADGIPVVVVSMDSASLSARVRPALRAQGIELPIVLDTTRELARRYGIDSDASTVITGSAGTWVHRSTGGIDGQVSSFAMTLADSSPQTLAAR